VADTPAPAVLDLSAVFTRDTVTMPDGTSFELRNRAEFSIVDDHKMQVLLHKVVEIDEAKVAESEEEAEKASKDLHDLAAMLVVDLPTEGVEDWVCAAIFDFWMQRRRPEEPANPPRRTPAARPTRQKKKTAAPKKSTTAGSSRASRHSTAAPRKRGSRKSRPTS
jgi:hypothetical protein